MLLARWRLCALRYLGEGIPILFHHVILQCVISLKGGGDMVYVLFLDIQRGILI